MINAIVACIFILSWSVLAKANPLKPGDVAPDFQLADESGVIHSLSQYKGKTVALFFYPKNDTPGCTREACSLRDGFSELKENGVVLLGVSYDDADSHKKFKAKHNLPFSLLSDSDKKVSELYHTKGVMFPDRKTFLIGPDGKIMHVFEKVDTSNHSQQILETLKTFKPVSEQTKSE